MGKSPGNRYKAGDFIKAMKGSGGIVTVIAERVGCDWHTADKWIKNAPTVKAAYDAEKEKVLDRAESVLIGNINEGDSADAKWYLTKKGKHRGYGDALQIEGDLNVTLDWGDDADAKD